MALLKVEYCLHELCVQTRKIVENRNDEKDTKGETRERKNEGAKLEDSPIAKSERSKTERNGSCEAEWRVNHWTRVSMQRTYQSTAHAHVTRHSPVNLDVNFLKREYGVYDDCDAVSSSATKHAHPV